MADGSPTTCPATDHDQAGPDHRPQGALQRRHDRGLRRIRPGRHVLHGDRRQPNWTRRGVATEVEKGPEKRRKVTIMTISFMQARCMIVSCLLLDSTHIRQLHHLRGRVRVRAVAKAAGAHRGHIAPRTVHKRREPPRSHPQVRQHTSTSAELSNTPAQDPAYRPRYLRVTAACVQTA